MNRLLTKLVPFVMRILGRRQYSNYYTTNVTGFNSRQLLTLLTQKNAQLSTENGGNQQNIVRVSAVLKGCIECMT